MGNALLLVWLEGELPIAPIPPELELGALGLESSPELLGIEENSLYRKKNTARSASNPISQPDRSDDAHPDPFSDSF
jgi:hypothetical protein